MFSYLLMYNLFRISGKLRKNWARLDKLKLDKYLIFYEAKNIVNVEYCPYEILVSVF